MTTPATRLRHLRIAAGYANPTSFADAHGLKAPTYLSHEREETEKGHRGIRRGQAETYAKLFKASGLDVTADWILHGSGPTPPGIAAANEPAIDAVSEDLHRHCVHSAALAVLEAIDDEPADVVAQAIVDLATQYTRQFRAQNHETSLSIGGRVVRFPALART